MAQRRGPRGVADRVGRLLVMLPWLAERKEATLAEMSERFQLTVKELEADLELAACCGLPPYIEECIDLYIDEGVAYMDIPRLFTRPLQLTAPEAWDLLAASRVAAALPGNDTAGPLARALAKLEGYLGDDGVVLELGQPPATASVVQAIEAGRRMAITYWSASSHDTTERTITPRTVFSDRGNWYVDADDDRSGEARRFRIDRITDWTITDDEVAARDVAAPSGDAWFEEFSELSTVTVELRGEARWAAERYPVRIEADDGATVKATFAVADARWLDTLLLQLGPNARVLEPASRRDSAAEAASALLAARYSDDS